jgi:hypothetical protein
VRSVLLPHEVNDRNFSATQGAQDIVIIKARGAVGRLGANGSLNKRSVCRGEAILEASSVQYSPPSSAPENVSECGIEALRRAFGSRVAERWESGDGRHGAIRIAMTRQGHQLDKQETKQSFHLSISAVHCHGIRPR